MTSRSAGVNHPAVSRMLDEEGMERDEQLREGERVPASTDVDFHCRRDAVAGVRGCW